MISICSLYIHYQEREIPIEYIKSFTTSYYIYIFNWKSKNTLQTPFSCGHDILWNIKFPEFLSWWYFILKKQAARYKIKILKGKYSQISSSEFITVFNNRNFQKRRFLKLFIVIGYMLYLSKGTALMKI